MFAVQEKAKIQKDLSILTDRLSKINEVGVYLLAHTDPAHKQTALFE